MLQKQIALQLQNLAVDSTLWLAYSGGLDSHVLLDIVAKLELKQTIRAIHIHHGLQSIADQWVQHCQDTCDKLNIQLSIKYLQLKPKTGESIEALAREQRYQAFSQLLNSGDYLLTAQHADDQAETLLLQLLRGAGSAGLAAMPAQRSLGKGVLLRPLLKCSQADLRTYAKDQQLHWIEDPSNQDLQFDRNYLRQQIMPLLTARWPGAVKSLGRSALHQADNLKLLEQMAAQDYKQCCLGDKRLSIPKLQSLNSRRQQQLLRYWIKQAGFTMPNQARLHSLQQSLGGGHDRQLLLQWQQYEIRSYRQALYIQPQLPPAPKPQQGLIWEDLQMPLDLPLGQLQITDNIDFWQSLAPLEIRFRQGGERLTYYRQEKTLKNLLQSSGIVPWLRPYLPLVYQDKTLIAIPKTAICDRLHHENHQALLGLVWSCE